jgi:hypothetical protein
VVAEVYYNNGWHMFDADQNVYFTDSTGEVVSLNYVSSHPELFLSGKNKLHNYGALPYVNYLMKRIYTTQKNNTVSDIYKDIPYDYNSALTLKSGDEIRFEISKVQDYEKTSHFFTTHSVSEFRRKGTLIRNSFLESVINSKDEAIIHESLPYAVKGITVKNNWNQTKGYANVSVYYSPNGEVWHFKGVLGNGFSEVTFVPFISSSESITFSYYLKFKSADEELSKKYLKSISVENDFLFSDKIFLNGTNSFRIQKTESSNFPVHLKISAN